MNGVIRGAGHPEYTLRINIVNVIVMVITASILVSGVGPFPALGVRGAGWAAVIGSASGVAAQLITLAGGKAGVRLHLKDVRPDLPVMKRILRIAIPTSAQRFSPNLANALLMRLVSSLGNDVLTAYSLVSRLYGFLQCLAFGARNASATMVGQNLGARQPERAERATILAARFAVGAALLLFGALNIWVGPILGLFGPTEAVLAIGVIAVRYMLFRGMATACSEAVGGALSGGGDVISTMLISIGSLWLVQLPLCWGLSRALHMGPEGIWAGLVLGYFAGAIAIVLRFRQGRWKEIKV